MKPQLQTNNRLKGLKFYLAGPINKQKFAECVNWRSEMSRFLWSRGAGVLNPLDKPVEHHEDESFQDKLLQLKQEEKYDELTEIMRPIVTIDLHLVDLSSAVILYIDKDCHLCGSYAEMTYTCLERKPLIVVIKQGKKQTPAWLFGHAKHELFFNDFTAAKEYLEHIDNDEVIDTLNHRWKFLNSNKIYGLE